MRGCNGQRYIAAGRSAGRVELFGTPGNALGAYLDGAELLVHGNGQDAVGDTMNRGRIAIGGSCGDGLGYGMRGGLILVKENVGYRAGIHMKAYEEQIPAIVIGGRAGNFLGEYQAGGLIAVLGLWEEDRGAPVGAFCGTGIHGGKILLRAHRPPEDLPAQASAHAASPAELEEFLPYLDAFCAAFGVGRERVLDHPFQVLVPNTKNPYQQLYISA